MAIASRFRHTIVIHRWTAGGATDSRGARNDTWEPEPTTVRGWVQPRRGREIGTDEGAAVAISDSMAFLDISAVVSPRDILQEGDRLFAIVGPARDAGGRGRHLELDLRLVSP